MTKKGKCIVYANCQRQLIERFLKASSSFNRNFELEPSVPFNFEAIKNQYIIPDSILKDTKLFIYQPIRQDKYDQQSSDSILSRLPSDCACVSFPHIQFNGYHPQYIHNPLNRSTQDYPYGKMPYGDSNIIKMIESGVPRKEILQDLNRVDFYSQEFLLKAVNSTLENLSSRELETDIRISNFIRANYQNQYLFYTVNHPANIIGIEIVKQILKKLNMLSFSDLARFAILHQGGKLLNAVNYQTKVIRIFKENFGDYQVPIYSSVIQKLGLTFVQTSSRYQLPFADRKLTFNEYLEEYFAQYQTV